MKTILILAFLLWGFAWFLGGYFIGSWIGWDKGYEYGERMHQEGMDAMKVFIEEYGFKEKENL